MFARSRVRKSIALVVSGAAVFQLAGACLPADFFASLAGTILTVAAETAVSSVVGTAVTGATNNTTDSTDTSNRTNP